MELKDAAYYGLTEAAHRLQVDFATLVEYIHTGQINACRDKAFPQWCIEKNELQRFYDSLHNQKN